MPYVAASRRNGWLRSKPTTPGDLNFDITSLLLDYLTEHGTSYTTINAAVGALECCKQEFYRRVAVPYEEQKKLINGDVY